MDVPAYVEPEKMVPKVQNVSSLPFVDSELNNTLCDQLQIENEISQASRRSSQVSQTSQRNSHSTAESGVDIQLSEVESNLSNSLDLELKRPVKALHACTPSPKSAKRELIPLETKQSRRSRSMQDVTLPSLLNFGKSAPENVMEGMFISNYNDHKVYTRMWLPEGKAKALLFISHGFGEHCARYDTQANAFNKKGFLVFSHDHQGHGRSEGEPRGDITNFSIYTHDVVQHLEMIISTYRGLPCFIWGHAMGGCIAITLARKHHDYFAGMLLTAPLVMPDPLASTPFKKLLARNIQKLNPKFNIGRIDPASLSADPERIKLWTEDPLNYHGPLRLRWANEMLKAATENYNKLYQVSTPFIALQGRYDDIVVPEGVLELQKRTSSLDKTIRMFDELYHDLHGEKTRAGKQVLTDLIEWTVAHVPDHFDTTNLVSSHITNTANADARRQNPTSV